MAATASRSTRPRSDLLPLLLIAALAAVLLCAPLAAAAPGIHADPADAPGVRLPPATGARAAATGNEPRWLIGASGPRTALAAAARRHEGRLLPAIDVLAVPRSQARAAVRAAGIRVRWAGPSPLARPASSFESPGGAMSAWSRPTLGIPASGPLATIGIVDDLVDPAVAELAGTTRVNDVPITDGHGTMVASVAAAPQDGRGVVGVAPGARVLSYGTHELDCADVASGISRLTASGARVINVSLTFEAPCPAITEAVAFAYRRGTTIVAASGNDGDAGNPRTWPASLPHVITVGAVDRAGRVPRFSARSRWVDLVAPGVAVPVTASPAYDLDDGLADGLLQATGTSLAAPAVAAACAWLLGSNGSLDPGQVAAMLRAGAIDRLAHGWDSAAGFGSLQVGASLGRAVPVADPLEPNDAPDLLRDAQPGPFRGPALWAGGAAVSLAATADSADDVIDGYRVVVPARGRAIVRVRVARGDVDLYAFARHVERFVNTPSLGASTRRGTATETIVLRNRARSARSTFVVVHAPAPSRRVLSRYRVSISR